MKPAIAYLLTLFTLLQPLSLSGSIVQIPLGPEIYYVTRDREGGVKQSGVLFGIRGGYEKIEFQTLYYAVDALYSTGILEGHKKQLRLKSEFTNSNIETRFGYTLGLQCISKFWLTPFVGVGTMWEFNHYKHPSPLRVHFDNQYLYLPFGFLASFHFTPAFSVGFNFKGRFIWSGRQKVSHDSEFSNMWQCYQEFIQYRYELPIESTYCWNRFPLNLRLTPFYETRHYGRRANFPFDYIDTQYRFYGATLQLLCKF